MNKIHKKRQFSEITESGNQNEHDKPMFRAVWINLPWHIKSSICKSLVFYSMYKDKHIENEILRFRHEISKIYFIPYTKLVYFFLANVCNKKFRSFYNDLFSNIKSEDYSLFSVCKFILLTIGKKNLDPNEKKLIQVHWPNIGISFPLSYKELLFYYFVFKFHIVHFVQKKETELEKFYLFNKTVKVRKNLNLKLFQSSS